MTFEVAFDLTSLLVLIIVPPIILFLCRSAWIYANDVRTLAQNRYVTKVIKENNEVWKEYLDLQSEFKALKDEWEYD